MKKLWFRAKRYGWGWYPVSWQGWVVTILYAFVLALSVGRASNYALEHAPDGLSLVAPLALHILWIAFLIGTLIAICYKTGEEPGWSWGQEEEDDDISTPNNSSS